MKKNVKQIILVVGLLTYLVGTLIASMSEDYGLIAVNSYLALYPILTIAFCFAQSKALNATGYTINAIAGMNALTIIISAGDVEDVTLLLPYIGLIIMFVASFCYLVPAILKFFGFVKAGKAQKTSNEKIELLRLYAELNSNEIITDDEFATIKTNVIKGNVKDNTEKLNQIKELKKLFDEQVITKEEFISFNK